MELTVVLVSIYIGILIGKNQVVPKPTAGQTSAAASDKITVTGVIRTGGLAPEEKLRLNLPAAAFQLTDFVKPGEPQKISGYYLLATDQTVAPFLGKCVRVSGTIPEDWKVRDLADSYSRSVLNALTLEEIPTPVCQPYAAAPQNNYPGEKMTLNGIIGPGHRPAPDIGYDYQIELTTPFIDETSASGSPQPVSAIGVVPGTNAVWLDLEKHLGKKVEINGYLQWGYAESKIFEITSFKAAP